MHFHTIYVKYKVDIDAILPLPINNLSDQHDLSEYFVNVLSKKRKKSREPLFYKGSRENGLIPTR